VSDEESEFLQGFYQAIEHREPLEWNHRWRVDLYADEHLAPIDPVAQLRRGIEWSALESVHLFSGFRGTGKTTELRRLAHELRESGIKVIVSDVRNYLNLAESLDIGEFLLAIAGAFGDAMADTELLGWDPLAEGYWVRFRQFLTKTKVDMGTVDLGPTGIRANLKDDLSFRSKLRGHMAGRVGALVEDVRGYMREVVSALRKKHGRDTKIVFILDSIEHIAVPAENHRAVTEALERVFTLHADKLKFEDMHLIYTVPPWLKIRSPGVGGLYQGAFLLPCIKVHERSGDGFEPGVDLLQEIVHRRAPEGNWPRLLSEPQLRRLIAASGGYIRDLFQLLRACLMQAPGAMPLTDQRIDLAIAQVKNDYLPAISHQDARWLSRIARTHESELASDDGLPDLSRYFDTHLMLCYRNGVEWYDVHPLVADEVRAMVARLDGAG
jgi:hypothetical protein